MLKKENRFSGDSKGTFGLTMMNFGQAKGNLQDSIKAFVQTDNISTQNFWGLSVTSLGGSSKEILPAGTITYGAIVNSGNAYFAVSNSQMIKTQEIINEYLKCTAPCKSADVDFDSDMLNSNYINMIVKIMENKTLTLQIPIKDLIYKVKGNLLLQYSVADISHWISLGIVSSDTTFALGRQFLINTYLTFSAKSSGERFINIGQLQDMGKITPSERLGLMLFGVAMVLIILIA